MYYSDRNTSCCTKPPCVGNIYTDTPYIPLAAAHGSLFSFDPMLMLETMTPAIKNVKRFRFVAIRCYIAYISIETWCM
jgi:hypothetical protein